MSYTVQYPTAVPAATAIYSKTDDVDFVLSDDFDGLRRELAAVCATLGVNPQGAYDSVVARLNAGGGGGGFTALVNDGSVDFIISSFNQDTNWNYLDLSSLVPSGARCVLCHWIFKSSTLGATLKLKSTSESTDSFVPALRVISANIELQQSICIPIESDGRLYYKSSASSVFSTLTLRIGGYWV